MKPLMSFAVFYSIILVVGTFLGFPDVWLAASTMSGNIFVAAAMLLRAIKEPTP